MKALALLHALKRWAMAVSLGAATLLSGAWAQTPFEVGANTTIYFSDTLSPLVWEDKGGDAGLAQARQHLSEFKPIDSVDRIDPKSRYWVVQRLANRLDENREFIVDAGRTDRGFNWLRYQHYVVYPDGSSRELNGPFSDNIPVIMGDIDPHVFNMDTTLSRSPVFTLHRNSEVQLFSRLKSNSTFPASSFALRIYDRTAYLELRQYGLYLEGILAGILLPLLLVTWYNLIYKREAVSVVYALWLVAALLQILTTPTQDGQRLYEFFLSAARGTIGVMPANIFWLGLFSYLQLTLFIFFGSTFLGMHKHLPRFYRVLLAYVGFEGLRFVVGYFFEHEIPGAWFWIPSWVFGGVVCATFPVYALIRYWQGLRSAQFAAFSAGIYALSWLFFTANWFGLSPFQYLPATGLGLVLKDSFFVQAFLICLPSIITSLSIQSRARGIEKRLRFTLVAQKEAAENQNKVLESTVLERTRELQAKHQALNAAHALVTESVQYASRLQRGQLPRAIRLENRFDSIATWWEPRDTIGGDLWWISSSQHKGPFVLAMADCTGHGVPGAMLSLLVSNSLDRIYANSTSEDPATALMSLDHFVRTGLNQDRPDSESDDGCDALILRIDRAQRSIEFAGAKIALFHVQSQGEVSRYPGARCSLGYIERIPDRFRPQVSRLVYAPGDLLAIVSDGLTDQIGQQAQKKSAYGYRRLEALLQKHAQAEASAVVAAIQQDFRQWQGDEARRDDVTVVVFRL